jgi:hypothetical protein
MWLAQITEVNEKGGIINEGLYYWSESELVEMSRGPIIGGTLSCQFLLGLICLPNIQDSTR